MRKTVALLMTAGLGLAAAACGTANAATPTTPAAAPAATTPPTTSASSLSDWYAGVETDFDAVRTDLTNIGAAVKAYDLPSMSSACTTLTDDVQTLQADPPAPVASVNTPLQAALTDYARAGEECTESVAETDVSVLNASAADITTGNSEMAQATGAMQG